MSHIPRVTIVENNLIPSSFETLPEYKHRPRQWAINLIANATKQSSKISFVYREILRYLLSITGELGYLDEEGNFVGVKCIHANPERTIAKLHQENNVILPILSIIQTTSDNSEKRMRTDHSLVLETVWNEDTQRALRVASIANRAVNINYAINIWAKYKADIDQLSEQIRLMFNPSLSINSDLEFQGIGFLSGERDESELSVADKADRVLRKSFDIQVQTYIPNPKFLITSTGKIEEIKLEYKTI